jgi:hypothetical protein
MTTEKVALSIPRNVLRSARRRVRAGGAKSLSALVSQALDEKIRRVELAEILDAMDERHGKPDEKARAWARKVLRP